MAEYRKIGKTPYGEGNSPGHYPEVQRERVEITTTVSTLAEAFTLGQEVQRRGLEGEELVEVFVGYLLEKDPNLQFRLDLPDAAARQLREVRRRIKGR